MCECVVRIVSVDKSLCVFKYFSLLIIIIYPHQECF